ncbi:hypothetical protein VTL71DRAFT_15104 [Oculimacula yallundae]|uniref:Uncharacterized protein n=1 Tax=Oculimacula yallundae TaxID=86028 RepID=A0ABR4CGX5_9HELO
MRWARIIPTGSSGGPYSKLVSFWSPSFGLDTTILSRAHLPLSSYACVVRLLFTCLCAISVAALVFFKIATDMEFPFPLSKSTACLVAVDTLIPFTLFNGDQGDTLPAS